MSDLFTAKSQRNITYLWLGGFFGIIAAQGMGYLKDVPYDVLLNLTTVVLTFWFLRSRSTSAEPNTSVTTTETVRKIEPTGDPNETK